MIRMLLLVATLCVGGSFAADRASIHEQIENCAVTSDARCLKDILHNLAAGMGNGPSGTVLVAGIYDKVNTSTNFCAQQIAPVVDAGVISYRVSYIEGCSFSEVFSCAGGICQNPEKNRTLTILSASSYNFDEPGSNSDFKRR